jgi:hypothetical protein
MRFPDKFATVCPGKLIYIKGGSDMISTKLANRVLCVFLFMGIFTPMAVLAVAPNPAITPGVLCTPTDPNFKGYDYPSQVARCNRNIAQAEKLLVAGWYGNIPEASWPNYEFDHLIPLCAGGSNDPKNLWPQPIAEAHDKDKVEVDVCLGLRAGTMTQAQAVQTIRDWVTAHQ